MLAMFAQRLQNPFLIIDLKSWVGTLVSLGRINPCPKGRRRLFKSGPAEEAIECRTHESGDYSPSRKGGLGGLPRENF